MCVCVSGGVIGVLVQCNVPGKCEQDTVRTTAQAMFQECHKLAYTSNICDCRGDWVMLCCTIMHK